jgi:hypothetical protein
MPYVLIATGPMGLPPEHWVGPVYVKSYDPDAFDGRGDAMFTTEKQEAATFGTRADAMKFWLQVPASRPKRRDGRPNRPLTAFTIEIVDFDKASLTGALGSARTSD